MNTNAVIVVGGAGEGVAHFGGVPLPLFDVLGRSVLQRLLDRLDRFGIARKTVVYGRGLTIPASTANANFIACEQHQLWTTAAQACAELAKNESGLVIAIGLGPYCEIDYGDLLRFHVRKKQSVTAVVDQNGAFAMSFVVNAASQKEVAYLFRHQFRTARRPYAIYQFSGYSNPLTEVADLRRLAIDSFCRNAEIEPDGDEVRPGVWISSSAVLHPRARVVAPVYIGHYAKVRASAVVTRCSVVEHHSEIGFGAVVDNATILPNTLVGPALDVSHAVVGLKRLSHLGRSIEIEINDARFIGQVSSAPVRLLEQLASLATYVPGQFLRGLISFNRNGTKSNGKNAQSPYPALTTVIDEEFPANFAGVRRYGDD